MYISFSSLPLLIVHERICIRGRQCQICQSVFSDRGEMLANHIALHTRSIRTQTIRKAAQLDWSSHFPEPGSPDSGHDCPSAVRSWWQPVSGDLKLFIVHEGGQPYPQQLGICGDCSLNLSKRTGVRFPSLDWAVVGRPSLLFAYFVGLNVM